MNNFEFDKICLAIALGLAVLLFSIDISKVIYTPVKYLKLRGYQIEIKEDDGDSSIPKIDIITAKLDIKSIMEGADLKNGEKIFIKCAICHTINKGDANKIGPNLFGIIGSKVASRADFSYSTAMIQKGKEIENWSEESLYRYLYSPKKYVPGTKMAFAGLKDDNERRDLIAYLLNVGKSQ